MLRCTPQKLLTQGVTPYVLKGIDPETTESVMKLASSPFGLLGTQGWSTSIKDSTTLNFSHHRGALLLYMLSYKVTIGHDPFAWEPKQVLILYKLCERFARLAGAKSLCTR